jgi:hypothetical protein
MLLDHFHPPLSDQRDWHGFHNAWATYLSASLNSQLPEPWFAQPHVEFGVEIDVATLEESPALVGRSTPSASSWLPSKPDLTISLPSFVDVIEVQIYKASGGRMLVGAIELISPANKDRPESRDAFVAKCESLLAAGIGLLIVDVVTNRLANLHELLLVRLGHAEPSGNGHLYAGAYHPVQRHERTNVDIWMEKIEIGKALPTMPLFLLGGPCVPVDLNATYQRTCTEQRTPGAAG